MARPSHIYRRGDQYWYRARVTVSPGRRIDVRLSLLTDSLFVAKQICSILEAARVEFASKEHRVFGLFSRKQPASSSPPPTEEDIAPLVRQFFVKKRNEAIAQRVAIADPDWRTAARQLCAANFDYANMLVSTQTTRSSVNWPRIEAWLDDEVKAGRMDHARASKAKEILRQNKQCGDTFPFSSTERDYFARQTGRSFGPDDLATLDNLFLEAVREAWFEVEVRRQNITATLGQTHVPDTFSDHQRPFEPPPLVEDLIEFPPAERPSEPEVPKATAESTIKQIFRQHIGALPRSIIVANDAAYAPAMPVHSMQPQQPAAPIAAAQPDTSVSIETAFGEFLAAQEREHKGKFKSRNQVRAMGKVLTYVIGGPDTPVSQLSQRHLGMFVETLRKMPTAWGRSPAEWEGGIAVSLERAAKLHPDAIGPSPLTEGRHLTYLGKFLNFCGGRGIASKDLDIKELRGERAKQRDLQKQVRGRDNWTAPEIERLLDAPPYTGSAGPSRARRYKAGNVFYSDSAYWMPLILVLHGFRCAEPAGLRVAHVNLNQPIPTFSIEPTDERGVKTAGSIREVPIHPELLRLGFVEFVEAVIQAGHTHLFPDLIPKSKSATPASLYYKSFIHHHSWAFPNGTSSKVVRGGTVQDKDVHSIRGFTITALEESKCSPKLVSQIAGHHKEPTSPTAPRMLPTTRRYLTPSTLVEMLNAMAVLTPVTQRLQPVPVKLNPLIYKK